MKRTACLLVFLAGLCSAQAPTTSNATSLWGRRITNAAPSDGNALVWNASQNKYIFSTSAAAIACAGTPGNTTGAYRQQCQDTNGALYACNNAAGCTVAGDWVAAGNPPAP